MLSLVITFLRNHIEKYYPLIIAAVLTVIFYNYQSKIENVSDVIKKLLDAALTICGVQLGFLLTILTIINSVTTRRMRFIKESGAYPLLTSYLNAAMYSNLVTVSIYFILPFVGVIQSELWRNILNSGLVFMVSYTWLLNIRFTTIFISLMTDPE